MADYRKTSSDYLNANSPGSEGNNIDSNYGTVNLLLDLGDVEVEENDEGGLLL